MKYLKNFESLNKMILMHNKDKSPYMGSTYGQDVEPAGYYSIEFRDFNVLPNNYEKIEYTYSKPLIINVDDDSLISWKYNLSNEYKATGKDLTKKLLNKGYDIIITKYPNGETGEIIILDTKKIYT